MVEERDSGEEGLVLGFGCIATNWVGSLGREAVEWLP